MGLQTTPIVPGLLLGLARMGAAERAYLGTQGCVSAGRGPWCLVIIASRGLTDGPPYVGDTWSIVDLEPVVRGVWLSWSLLDGLTLATFC